MVKLLALVQVRVQDSVQVIPLVVDLQWVLAQALSQELEWVPRQVWEQESVEVWVQELELVSDQVLPEPGSE